MNIKPYPTHIEEWKASQHRMSTLEVKVRVQGEHIRALNNTIERLSELLSFSNGEMHYSPVSHKVEPPIQGSLGQFIAEIVIMEPFLTHEDKEYAFKSFLDRKSK